MDSDSVLQISTRDRTRVGLKSEVMGAIKRVKIETQNSSPASSQRFYMLKEQPNNPLHGITLEAILIHLVEQHGWEELGNQITIKCFTDNPSIKSSLKFLRKTPWARSKVESLYLKSKLINQNSE